MYLPKLPGSRGANGGSSTYGLGGGVVFLTSNSLTIDGTISCDGTSGGSGGAAGGSGGSILIHTLSFGGFGTLSVSGGAGVTGSGLIGGGGYVLDFIHYK